MKTSVIGAVAISLTVLLASEAGARLKRIAYNAVATPVLCAASVMASAAWMVTGVARSAVQLPLRVGVSIVRRPVVAMAGMLARWTAQPLRQVVECIASGRQLNERLLVMIENKNEDGNILYSAGEKEDINNNLPSFNTPVRCLEKGTPDDGCSDLFTPCALLETTPANAKSVGGRYREGSASSSEDSIRSRESSVRSRDSGVASRENSVRSHTSTIRSREANLRPRGLNGGSARSRESGVVSRERSVNPRHAGVSPKVTDMKSRNTAVKNREPRVSDTRPRDNTVTSTRGSRTRSGSSHENHAPRVSPRTATPRANRVSSSVNCVTTRGSRVSPRDISSGVRDSRASPSDISSGVSDSRVSPRDIRSGARDIRASTRDISSGVHDSRVSTRDISHRARDNRVTSREITTSARGGQAIPPDRMVGSRNDTRGRQGSVFACQSVSNIHEIGRSMRVKERANIAPAGYRPESKMNPGLKPKARRATPSSIDGARNKQPVMHIAARSASTAGKQNMQMTAAKTMRMQPVDIAGDNSRDTVATGDATVPPGVVGSVLSSVQAKFGGSVKSVVKAAHGYVNVSLLD